MALTPNDVARLAELARLELNEQELAQVQTELNEALTLIQSLQAVNTDGVEPLTHPLSALEDISLRLRDDEPSPTLTLQEREAQMANAPAQQDGLFLVPRVIE
ncbi:Asp-tRNA(Asn)/Glu-tRNA(Gln) amidotransferase subunit GatC [Orrella sp. 11846]|uniref:Asp-tRNA(Asn)/Glu-tRNA(Gln) amidotransferase subunit GatC n=1 Tax=Orrella sp. 11846 TaxID=3409913 RepID=UPI003B5B5827